ncbi:hypothetical protein RE474_08395 [Methanolobus sediminis]|uniref:Uncharacterized protein n=1 Tax=Methanolobus sediminis TaxID=3072978 RepID=A0AA51YI43_9EURY|nr:hypothetical protein [Methanolobus sediminis]WMW24115.1 hypothetical protein RE474_08395 [Methanolobus sediminis]
MMIKNTTAHKTKTSDLGIVLFAARTDQEFAFLRQNQTKENSSYGNEWNDTHRYDQHSYENVYNQGYSDGTYGNFYSNGASCEEQSENDKMTFESIPLKNLLQIRADGFIHNFANQGIFFANENGLTLLNGIKEKTIGQIRVQNPEVIKALMI